MSFQNFQDFRGYISHFFGNLIRKNEELIIFFLDEVDTAIFYSITSTQLGLQGIELGNHLIKQVTDGVDIYW